MNLAVNKYKNMELKKHVNAIHCSNNLTLVQRKLFNALLFNAYPDLLNKPRFQIQSRDLCRLIGYNSNDYGKLKKALFGLINIAIEWNVINFETGKEKKWKASSILSAAELANGLCTYEYSLIMKELLYQPEIYGRVDLKLMSRFKSSYGLALYENCIRYQSLSQTPWFPLEIFRKLMGVFDDKYIIFKDFKKRVLNIAVGEVNHISTLSITPEIERQNQKVTQIRFKLSKKQSDLSLSFSIDQDKELNELLRNTFGLSVVLINELYAKYDKTFIQEKTHIIITSDSFKAGKIRGLAGYLMEALRKDYKINKSSSAVICEQRVKQEIQETNAKEKEEKLKNGYETYVRDKITRYYSSLTQDKKDRIRNDFVTHIKTENKLCFAWYVKNGLEHPGVKSHFNIFIREHSENEIGEIISFEEFANLINQYN